MKKILKSLLAVGVLFTAIGCNQDQIGTEFDPSQESQSAAFFAQKSISEEFINTATGDQKLLVEVSRHNNIGDAIVGIEYMIPTDARGIYTIPDQISFKNGEYKAVLEIIAHDVEAFAKGATYSATIGIGDSHDFKEVPVANAKLDKSLRSKSAPATRGIQITKFTQITISTSLALDWQPVYIPKDFANILKDKPAGTEDKDWYVLDEGGKPMAQTASWDDAWGFDGGTENLTVQRAAGTSVFRILNAGDGGMNVIFTVDMTEANKVTFDGEKYFRCVLTPQDTKMAYDDSNNIWISDFPSVNSSFTYNDNPCYWDGENSFVFSFYWHVPGLGGFTSPGVGITDIFVFDTGEAAPAKPKVNISYLGAKTSSTGIKTHPVQFEPNADVASYYATMLKEDLSLITDADALKNRLKEIQEALEAEDYKGDFARIHLTAKSEEAWDLGAAEATYTAVTLSFSKDKSVKQLNYKTITYNPTGDASKVKFVLVCGAGGYDTEDDYTDYSMGYFGDNSVMLYCEGVDITAMKYALLTVSDFNAAGLDKADDAAKIAYLDKSGRAASADMLKDINKVTKNGNNLVYMGAQPETAYKILASFKNPDATAVEVQDATTEATPASDFAVSTLLLENAKIGAFKHNKFVTSFSGAHIVGGKFMMLSTAGEAAGKPTTFGSYFDLKDGKLTLKSGVTDADVLSLIDSKGSAFSTAKEDYYENCALWVMNTGEAYGELSDATPASEYAVLAFADHDGSGAKSWSYSVIKTEYAPAVSFEQKIRIDGKNIRFTWVGAPTNSIFAIRTVVYALVPKAELLSAGVDASMISDEMLNNFDARRAASPADKAAIDAQEANAKKVRAILSAKGKTLKADAASKVNEPSGYTKQFENMASGDYALIAYADDKFNTKLTIGEAKIQ